jgi:hypothetical protein
MAFSPYSRLARPLELHNVRTADAYRAAQAAQIKEGRRRHPALHWRDPFTYTGPDRVVILVTGGAWKVVCPDCGNAPAYDPEWQLACCFECGARFEGLAPPADAAQIEALLMARPRVSTRNWMPRDTIADLVAENRAHGVTS